FARAAENAEFTKGSHDGSHGSHQGTPGQEPPEVGHALVSPAFIHSCRPSSISDIAEAPIATIEEAINDAKLAKSLHTACKGHGKKSTKRAAEDAASTTAKKIKLEPHKRDLDYSSMAPEEL